MSDGKARDHEAAGPSYVASDAERLRALARSQREDHEEVEALRELLRRLANAYAIGLPELDDDLAANVRRALTVHPSGCAAQDHEADKRASAARTETSWREYTQGPSPVSGTQGEDHEAAPLEASLHRIADDLHRRGEHEDAASVHTGAHELKRLRGKLSVPSPVSGTESDTLCEACGCRRSTPCDTIGCPIPVSGTEPLSPFMLRAADRLYSECERAVREGRVDARSPIGDATLDYREIRKEGGPPVSGTEPDTAKLVEALRQVKAQLSRINSDYEREDGASRAFVIAYDALVLAGVLAGEETGR